VPNKYAPLKVLLGAALARGQRTVELDFEAIAMAVGGLPPSSDVRQWWANSSQVQALAWRAAGFHVDFVSLDHKRVRFMSGEVGGNYHDHERVPVHPAPRRTPPPIVRVRLQWLDAGRSSLTAPASPSSPGSRQARGSTG
jgi:hypothetical protein